MKIATIQASMLMAVFLMGSGAALSPAYAEDTTVAEAMQALTDAVSSTTSSSDASVETTANESDELAADAAAGLPKFKSRAERRAYFEKMRQENPEKFQEMKKKRQEAWAANHPEIAKKIEERRQWAKEHPEEAQKMREEFRGKMEKMKEERREMKREFREKRRDFREDRRDAAHDQEHGNPDFPGRGHAYGKKKHAMREAAATN